MASRHPSVLALPTPGSKRMKVGRSSEACRAHSSPMAIPGSWRACVLLRPRQHQRYIIRLFVVADPVVDGDGNNFGDALQRQMAILAHQLDQPLLTKLAIIVFRLAHPIAVSHQHTACSELYSRFRKA